jgi:hypothetical protein
MNDFTIWVYAITVGLTAFGFFLFIWWWMRMRSASEVFIYVTLLLGFICFERIVLLYYRILLGTDIDAAMNLVGSDLWSLRTVPELIVVMLIIVRMARRACRTIRLERRYAKEPDVCEGFAHERED